MITNIRSCRARATHARTSSERSSADTCSLRRRPRDNSDVSAADALALTLLIREEDPARFPRAGARWHARFVLDTPRVGLGDSQLAVAAVAALPDRKAAEALVDLVRRYGVANLEPVLRRPQAR